MGVSQSVKALGKHGQARTIHDDVDSRCQAAALRPSHWSRNVGRSMPDFFVFMSLFLPLHHPIILLSLNPHHPRLLKGGPPSARTLDPI